MLSCGNFRAAAIYFAIRSTNAGSLTISTTHKLLLPTTVGWLRSSWRIPVQNSLLLCHKPNTSIPTRNSTVPLTSDHDLETHDFPPAAPGPTPRRGAGHPDPRRGRRRHPDRLLERRRRRGRQRRRGPVPCRRNEKGKSQAPNSPAFTSCPELTSGGTQTARLTLPTL